MSERRGQDVIDESERVAARAAAKRDPARAEALQEFRRLYGGAEGSVLEQVARHVRLLLRADAALVAVRTPEGLQWTGTVHCAAPTAQGREHETFADRATLSPVPLLFDDESSVPDGLRDIESLGWRSVASVPVLVRGIPVAAVLAGRTSGVPWGEREHEAARQWSVLLAMQNERSLGLIGAVGGEGLEWQASVMRAALPLALLDDAGAVRVANAAFCELTGLPPDGFEGQPLVAVLRGSASDAIALEEVWSGQRRQASAELPLSHADGVPRRVRVTVAQAPFADDGRHSYLATIEDITELRDATEALRAREAQLRLSQRREALGQLTGGLAHEFSNTLAAIIGFASLLRDDLDPTDPRRDDVEDILRVSSRGTELISRLLDLTPQRVSERATFDLREVLRAFSVVAHRVLPTTIEWSLDVPEREVQAVIDRAQIEQVLLGLVLNARDAMPRGGHLTVQLRTQLVDRGDGVSAPMACIAVSDTGEGISAEVLPQLWTPFFTTRPTGTGLGLSVGQAILREHGGDLRLESPAGVSATFAALLPLTPRTLAAVPTTDPKVIPLRAPPTGVTVLLAEDERAVRQTTVRILERAGYRVVATSDGEEAWRQLEEHPEMFDVLVSDLIMPRLSGAELVKRVRQRRPDFPIVVTSAHPSRDWDDRDLRVESVAVLKKPFGASTLLETLRTIVPSRTDRP
jgi:PAS domain S-box-containing protein